MRPAWVLEESGAVKAVFNTRRSATKDVERENPKVEWKLHNGAMFGKVAWVNRYQWVIYKVPLKK